MFQKPDQPSRRDARCNPIKASRLRRGLVAPAAAISLALAGGSMPAVAADLELYMDTETKQIFAEPGPGRQRLGKFRPVEDAAPEPANAPAIQPSAATQTPAATQRSGATQASAVVPAPAVAQPPAVVQPPTGVQAPTVVQTPAAVQAPAAGTQSPEMDLAQRVAKSEQEIEALEKRNADSTRSPFTSRFQIRGYLQARYTEMLGGDEGINLWSDRSVGDQTSLGDADKNYLIRRGRLIFQGDVGKRLSFYIQPDLASSAGTTGNVAQLRDAYGDVYLTTDRVHRLRVGQSKVPYGWENLQSSSNRLALDRADALNSAVRDERDLGIFYYFTPKSVQDRFNDINAKGLRHSGNYGMLGLGFYNGQGANRGDRNDNQHIVARATWPWKLANGQYFEAGIQGYHGKYLPSIGAYRAPGDVTRTPTIAAANAFGFEDERVAVSAIWYPQPFGLQAEWNWGHTPALDFVTNSIVDRSLEGGYVQAMYRFENRFGTLLPFVKWQYFDGASKAETNAPVNDVDDIEIGLEWQMATEIELAAVYHRMRRNNLVTGNTAGRIDYERFDAEALRLQLQLNF